MFFFLAIKHFCLYLNLVLIILWLLHRLSLVWIGRKGWKDFYLILLKIHVFCIILSLFLSLRTVLDFSFLFSWSNCLVLVLWYLWSWTWWKVQRWVVIWRRWVHTSCQFWLYGVNVIGDNSWQVVWIDYDDVVIFVNGWTSYIIKFIHESCKRNTMAHLEGM